MVILVTERLLLRQFHVLDGDAMEHVLGDRQVMQFSKGVKSPEQVRKWLWNRLGDYQRWGLGLWAVVEKAERQVIGYCGLSRFPDIEGQPETEIGYRLARAAWGRGFATEAARAVREFAFETLCLTRLIAIVDPKNTASIAVAEKVGLRYEREVTFLQSPVTIYAMSRPDRG